MANSLQFLGGLVLGSIEADFCKQICVLFADAYTHHPPLLISSALDLVLGLEGDPDQVPEAPAHVRDGVQDLGR